MSKVKMFFYAQRKSQFYPPDTASDVKPATIRGTLWCDREDGYLRLNGRGEVKGQLMLVDASEVPGIDKEEEQAGWHRVSTVTLAGEKAWTYQYRTDPPEDAVVCESWPLATGLRKSLAKPEQQPRTDGQTVESIENNKEGLDWKTKNVTLHKGNPVHAATGKLAAMIRQARSAKLNKTRDPSDQVTDGIRPPSKIAAARTQAGVPGENDSSPLTKALTPEGNRDEAHQTSRERKGNKDLVAKQPKPFKGKGARPTSGPGSLEKAGTISTMPKPAKPVEPTQSAPGLLDANKHAAEGWEGYNSDVFHGLDYSKSLAQHPGTVTPDILFASHPKSGKIKAVLKGSPPVEAIKGPHDSSFNHPTFKPPHREATYHKMADEVFGMGKYVPKTTVFKHPTSNKHWSAQQFVEGAEPYRNQNLDHLKDSGDVHKLAIMNMVLGNNDRHANNVMIDKQNNPVLIDNGLAFDYNHRVTDRLPAYANNILHEPVPKHVVDWADNLDTVKLANTLSRSGAPRDVVMSAVRRHAALRRWVNLMHHGHTVYGKEAMQHADRSLNGLLDLVRAQRPHHTVHEQHTTDDAIEKRLLGGAVHHAAMNSGDKTKQVTAQATRAMTTRKLEGAK